MLGQQQENPLFIGLLNQCFRNHILK